MKVQASPEYNKANFILYLLQTVYTWVPIMINLLSLVVYKGIIMIQIHFLESGNVAAYRTVCESII